MEERCSRCPMMTLSFSGMIVSFLPWPKAILGWLGGNMRSSDSTSVYLFLLFFLPSVVHNGAVVVRSAQVVAFPLLKVVSVNWIDKKNKKKPSRIASRGLFENLNTGTHSRACFPSWSWCSRRGRSACARGRSRVRAAARAGWCRASSSRVCEATRSAAGWHGPPGRSSCKGQRSRYWSDYCETYLEEIFTVSKTFHWGSHLLVYLCVVVKVYCVFFFASLHQHQVSGCLDTGALIQQQTLKNSYCRTSNVALGCSLALFCWWFSCASKGLLLFFSPHHRALSPAFLTSSCKFEKESKQIATKGFFVWFLWRWIYTTAPGVSST